MELETEKQDFVGPWATIFLEGQKNIREGLEGEKEKFRWDCGTQISIIQQRNISMEFETEKQDFVGLWATIFRKPLYLFFAVGNKSPES